MAGGVRPPVAPYQAPLGPALGTGASSQCSKQEYSRHSLGGIQKVFCNGVINETRASLGVLHAGLLAPQVWPQCTLHCGHSPSVGPSQPAPMACSPWHRPLLALLYVLPYGLSENTTVTSLPCWVLVGSSCASRDLEMFADLTMS